MLTERTGKWIERLAAGMVAVCAFQPALADGLNIVGAEPAPRTVVAPVDAPLVVHFDKPIDAASLVPLRSFWAFARWSGTVSGTFRLSNSDKTVTLTPDQPFSRGSR